MQTHWDLRLYHIRSLRPPASRSAPREKVLPQFTHLLLREGFFPAPPFFPQTLAPILRYDFAHLPPDERNRDITAHVTLTSQYTIPYYDATLLRPHFHHLH